MANMYSLHHFNTYQKELAFQCMYIFLFMQGSNCGMNDHRFLMNLSSKFVCLYQMFHDLINFHILESFEEDNLSKLLRENLVLSKIVNEIEQLQLSEDELIDLAIFKKKTEYKLSPNSIKFFEDVSQCEDFFTIRECEMKTVASKVNKKMSVKKTYEVQLLSKFLQEIAEENDLNCFVDIGAGRGSISSDLANRGYQVFAIEKNSCITNKLKETLYSQNIKNLTVLDFEIETNTDVLKLAGSLTKDPYILYSLHACGNLSDSMLRIFSNSDSAKVLVNIGCCYNLMDLSQFPSSEFMKSLNLKFSSKNSLMTGCQCPSRWNSDRNAMKDTLKRNHFRAMLTVLLRYLGNDDVIVGKLPKFAYENFTSFCHASFKKFNLQNPSNDDINHVYAMYGSEKHRLDIIWILKLLMGPCIEGLIILDRYWFVKEKKIAKHVSIEPVFDRARSPRNIAIVAIKN